MAVYSLHIVDEPLATCLADLFAGKTVLSLGEGAGDYRRLVLNASSKVKLLSLSARRYTSADTSSVFLCLSLSITSRSSVEVNGQIELVFRIETSVDL